MSHCPTCKESIISQTPFLIGKTECTSDCPEAITCQDIIPSNCVFYSGNNLSCSGIAFGDTVTVAISKLDAAICQGSTQKCTVSIDANDTCCNYLGGKLIAGTGITIDRNIPENTAGCKTLTISQGCNTWNSVGPSSSSGTGNFRNGWRNCTIGGLNYQPAEYSNVVGCVVRLRGVVTLRLSKNNCAYIVMVLPPAQCPSKIRVFSVNVFIHPDEGCATIFPATLSIETGGNVVLRYATRVNENYSFSLDGLTFETV